jgi:glycosyltransferase involved in cell wall biosynthesis
MKISASLIVKNESNHLRHALDSILGLDEIVIVDTGSTDNTIEIAKSYTDKVYYGDEYNWKDDFAFHRNQSLKKCTGDWVFIIDADEYLEPGGIDKLKKYINLAEEKGYTGLLFETKSSSGNDKHMSIRAFKRLDNISWKGAAHNYLVNVKSMKTDIIHYYGYSDAHKLDPDRTLRILKKYCNDNPKCTRERYYLAREYWYRKDYNQAIKHYDIYLLYSKFTKERADALLTKAKCLWYLQKGEDARQTCLQAIYHNPDFKEALLFMSKMHFEPRKTLWKKIADNAKNSDVLFLRTE